MGSPLCRVQASLPLPGASRQSGFLVAGLQVSEHLEAEVETLDGVWRSSLGSQVLSSHSTAEIRQSTVFKGENGSSEEAEV